MSQSKEDRRRAKIERMRVEPGSSYFKVMVSLSMTESCNKLRAAVAERVSRASVVGHRFSFNKNYTEGRYDSYPMCLIDYGGDKPYSTGWSAGSSTFTAPRSVLVTDGEIAAVVSAHWATKECPTYNCARDVVDAKFPDFLRERLLKELEPEIVAHQNRIAEEWSERRSSHYFRKDREESRATHCIQAIRGHVQEFYKKRGGKALDSDGAADCLRRAAEEILSQDVLLE